MKRYGNLYDKIINKENLRLAHYNARKGKAFYKEVKEVDSDIEKYINDIYIMLRDETYVVSEYKTFVKTDSGKEREIFVLPYYPDRIIQWAIVQVCEPIWMNAMIHQTYSSLKGRGIHQALKHLKRGISRDPTGVEYCLKFDIRKFYPSINHNILKTTIRNKIKDQRLLKLIDHIIDSADGVPIGNYLSQFFGNLYLTEFDHWMKEKVGLRHYYRYCDDIVILHHDKKYLQYILFEIKNYLFIHLGLNLKQNYQVFPTHVRGIDFVGYRVFQNYVLLRKNICKKMKKKMSDIGRFDMLSKRDQNVIGSYSGWLKWCDCNRLYVSHIEQVKSKEVIP